MVVILCLNTIKRINMKKSLLSISLIVALGATSAMGTETQWFVGADMSSVKAKSTLGFTGTATINGTSYSNLSATSDESDTGFGIKVGAVMNKNHRMYLNYTTTSFEFTDLTTYAANYDYLFDTNSKVTPYLGANVGIANIEALGLSDQSVGYGVQAGILYPISDNLEFELGLSYSTTDAKITTPTVSASYGNITLTNASAYLEADSMIKASVGLNYKF